MDTNEPESLMLLPAHKASTGQFLFHPGDSFFSQSGKLRITVIETTPTEATVRIDLAAAHLGLNVSQERWVVTPSGGSRSVFVDAGGAAWSASSSASWLTVSPASSSGTTLSLTASSLNGGQREAAVTVTSGTRSATITVSQVDIDDCASATSTACEFAIDGDIGTATGSLERGSDRDWWRLVPTTSGTWTVRASGVGDVYGTVMGASGDMIRTDDDSAGNLQFLLTWDAVAGQTYYIEIRNFTSSDATVNTGVYTLRAAPARVGLSTEAWDASVDGDSVTVTVTSNTREFTARTSANWLTVSPTSGDNALAGQVVTLTAAATSEPARTGTVTFTAGTAARTLTVTQVGTPATIAVLPESATVSGAPVSQVVRVSVSRGTWTVRSQPSWVTIMPTTGVSGDVHIDIDGNGGGERSGTIVFAAGDATAEVLIVQSAGEMTLAPSEWRPPGTASQRSAELVSDLPWSVESAPPWLRVTPGSGGPGSQTLSLSASDNPGTQERSGTLVITAGPLTQAMTIVQPGTTSIVVGPSPWSAPASASTTTAWVDTDGSAWHVSSSSPWLTVEPTSGVGSGPVTLTAAANPGAARQGEVVFATGTDTSTMAVSQAAAPTGIAVTPTRWEPSYASSSTEVELSLSYGTWVVQSKPSWVNVAPDGGVAGPVTLSAGANSGGAREGTVVFAANGETASVLIRQGIVPTLSVSRMSWSAPARGDSTTTTVTTNQATWSATATVPWLSVSPSSGVSGTKVTVTALPASTPTATSGTVTFTAGGISRTMTVSQAAGTLTLSRKTWSPDDGGASTTTRVTTVQPVWQATVSEPWLSITPTTGASGDSIRVTAAVNAGPARTGTVHVVAGGLAADLTVTQHSAPAPTMSLTRTSWTAEAGVDGTSSRVTTNQAVWTAEADVTWLTMSPVTGVSGTIMEVFTATNTGPARMGHVTVRAAGPVGSISRVLTVSQRAATVSTSVSSWSPSATGAITTPKVSTNQPAWTASSDADWLSIIPAAGVDGDEMIWLAYRNTGARRVATVTVRAGEVVRTVTVTQAAPASASVSLSRTSWAAPSSAGSVPVTVTVNRPEWAATSTQPWLSVSEGHGVSGRTVTVEVEPNTGTGSRTGAVTVTAGGASRTLTVTQAAGPGRIAASHTVWMAGPAGASLSLAAVTAGGGTWTASESATWLGLSTTGAVASGGTRTLTASANTTTSRRSATVTIKSGSDSTTLTVVQDTSRGLSVGRSTWSPSGGGASVNTSVDVYNEGTWTAASDQPWLLPGGPTDPSDDGLTLVAEPNTGPARTGAVTVTSGTQTVTIQVTQRAG
ncbi:MAG: hypothetical protein LBK72_04200 [Bifidobacteriaceae bacterium]|nr:hypothetical protein [Bifidobacteriaceae bacterium]